MKKTYLVDENTQSKFELSLHEAMKDIQSEGEKFVDIKFSTCMAVDSELGYHGSYSALIIYETPDQD